jgi:hypothetical protein
VIFERLLKHIGRGLSFEGFADLSMHTIEKYLEKYPEEFNRERYQKALKKGRSWWESIGQRQTEGTCNGNSRTWYYNMSNKYGWSERQQVQADTKTSGTINIISYASKAS